MRRLTGLLVAGAVALAVLPAGAREARVPLEETAVAPAPGVRDLGDPFPDDARHVTTVTVEARDADGTASMRLLAGTLYVLEAAGRYKYSPETGSADAECFTATALGASSPSFGSYAQDDPLDVYVDGSPIVWQPLEGTADSSEPACSAASVYRTLYTGNGAGVRLRIVDFPWGYGDNAGALEVNVYEAQALNGARPIGSIFVDARLATPTPTMALGAGVPYILEASGRYKFADTPGLADAECSSPRPDALPSESLGSYGADDPLDVTVNGAAVRWIPVSGTEYPLRPACSQASLYRLLVTGTGAPATLRIWDFGWGYGDNGGGVVVTVYEGAANPG